MQNNSINDIKTQHEVFVSGHNGSDNLDILFVAHFAPLSLFLLKLHLAKNGGLQGTSLFLIEFVFVVGTLICSLMTNMTKIYLFLFFVIQLILIGKRIYDDHNPIEVLGDDEEAYYSNYLRNMASARPSYLTNYRAFINLATSICILGVDFKAFPRRFCKTETFGTSVMDAGVGSFVMSNGIISREARGIPSRIGWREELKSTWPLLLLGFVRLAVLKTLGYHEHVTEYGLHWNFFFTLAFVKIASSFLFRLFSTRHSITMAIIISLIYELLLTLAGFSDYLLEDGNRTNIFHANREGMLSCLGYLSLYLSSVALGSFIFEIGNRHYYCYHVGSYRYWLKVYLKLVMVAVTMWATLYLYQSFVSQASRRMANLPYVVWMVAYNAQMVSSFLLVDLTIYFVSDHYEWNRNLPNAKLLDVINRHSLPFFLLSNLATGLVNFSLDTVQANFATSMLVMITYMFFLCGLFTILDHFKWKLKLL